MCLEYCFEQGRYNDEEETVSSSSSRARQQKKLEKGNGPWTEYFEMVTLFHFLVFVLKITSRGRLMK